MEYILSKLYVKKIDNVLNWINKYFVFNDSEN